MNFIELKDKQRKNRDAFSDNLGLRVHRALSWLNKSEQCEEDKDSQFIFLWIAFNAAYAQDVDILRQTEAKAFSAFITKLVELDENNELHSLVWSEFSSSIRVLLDNEYIFQPFWDFQNGKLTEEEWKEKFNKAKSAASFALANTSTDQLISIVLYRLYTLRNQLMHGGATWQGSANREQIRDAVSILSKLVPIIINIMMDNSDQLWGDANYPVIQE